MRSPKHCKRQYGASHFRALKAQIGFSVRYMRRVARAKTPAAIQSRMRKQRKKFVPRWVRARDVDHIHHALRYELWLNRHRYLGTALAQFSVDRTQNEYTTVHAKHN